MYERETLEDWFKTMGRMIFDFALFGFGLIFLFAPFLVTILLIELIK